MFASSDGCTAFRNSVRDALDARLGTASWDEILGRLQGFKGFGEFSRVVLRKAYEQAIMSTDALVMLDSTADKAKLTWIVNQWDEWVKLI